MPMSAQDVSGMRLNGGSLGRVQSIGTSRIGFIVRRGWLCNPHDPCGMRLARILELNNPDDRDSPHS